MLTYACFFPQSVYESESALIPKNTSVIVARVPVGNSANSKKAWNNKTSDNNKNNVNKILICILSSAIIDFFFHQKATITANAIDEKKPVSTYC